MDSFDVRDDGRRSNRDNLRHSIPGHSSSFCLWQPAVPIDARFSVDTICRPSEERPPLSNMIRYFAISSAFDYRDPAGAIGVKTPSILGGIAPHPDTRSARRMLWGTERTQGSSGVGDERPNASAILQEKHGHYSVDFGVFGLLSRESSPEKEFHHCFPGVSRKNKRVGSFPGYRPSCFA